MTREIGLRIGSEVSDCNCQVVQQDQLFIFGRLLTIETGLLVGSPLFFATYEVYGQVLIIVHLENGHAAIFVARGMRSRLIVHRPLVLRRWHFGHGVQVKQENVIGYATGSALNYQMDADYRLVSQTN